MLRRDGSAPVHVPWYLDKESEECFPTWNLVTRAALVWRCLTEQGLAFVAAHPERCLEFRYEDFVGDPEAFVRDCETKFARSRTGITRGHVEAVKSHGERRYPSIVDQIEPPEREKSARLMECLGYAA